MNDIVQMSIEPENIYLTFGSSCDCGQDDSVTLATISTDCFWPCCPVCGISLDLVNVVVNVPVYKWPIK